MARNLFVGSLSYSCTDKDLEELFAAVGPVKSAKIINDRETGRSRGFGFVEMESDDDGERAIQRLDGTQFMRRQINVRVANPRQERGSDRGRANAG